MDLHIPQPLMLVLVFYQKVTAESTRSVGFILKGNSGVC